MRRDGKKDFNKDSIGKVTFGDIVVGATLWGFSLAIMWFSSSLMIHLIR